MTEHGPDPDEFREFLQRMFGGQLPGGASSPDLEAMFRQIRGAFAGAGTDPWENARQTALHAAGKDDQALTASTQASLADAFTLANLWLGEATSISELAELPTPMTRAQWVTKTMPAWQEIAAPVATSITDAFLGTLDGQIPEEMRDMITGAGELLRGLSTSLFAAQLGRVIGQLSLEVVIGGEVGIPVLPAGTAAVIPQNIAEFGAGLEVPDDQVALFLATRELAYARLYRHAKWLRLHVMSQITEFARGITIDTRALEEVAESFDPSNPDELRAAIEGGALIPEHSETQKEALTRLENLVATIDGWVDVVTAQATARLPDGIRLAEASRRRRAAGGPAEDALGALVGVKLRPKRLREAAAMWQAVTDAVGIDARDTLWDYPDLMPQASDIDDPTALIERLQATARGEAPLPDEMDEALARLLDDEEPPS